MTSFPLICIFFYCINMKKNVNPQQKINYLWVISWFWIWLYMYILWLQKSCNWIKIN